MRIVLSGQWNPGLQSAEGATLLQIARDSLAWATAGKPGRFPYESYILTPTLQKALATFVTLHRHGNLRGCIGTLAPQGPVYRSVHENAVLAALEDYRFDPLTREELPDVMVHVSILSLPELLASLDDFQVGAQGIILKRGRVRAVFLPEVAREQGWTREMTAMQLCLKAGLPPDAWQSETTFEGFYSAVLSET